ncbi:MAG: hypothetical protein P1U89_26885 [Verrucomicrobiales bacterium]|nr:hypothetical protein [Verrucomicrobiales bacterium]
MWNIQTFGRFGVSVWAVMTLDYCGRECLRHGTKKLRVIIETALSF